MTDRIRVGTLLIKDGTHTPESFAVDTEHYSTGWSSILKSTSADFGRKLESAGWTFFYMASAIRTTSFGFLRDVSELRGIQAIQAVGGDLELRRLNLDPGVALVGSDRRAHARSIDGDTLSAADGAV